MPSNQAIEMSFSIGTSGPPFWSRLRYTCLYFSGHNSFDPAGVIDKYTPVNGGENFSSRYRCDITELKFAPALVPPTKKPFAGFPPNCLKFLAVLTVSACQLNCGSTDPFQRVKSVIYPRRKRKLWRQSVVHIDRNPSHLGELSAHEQLAV